MHSPNQICNASSHLKFHYKLDNSVPGVDFANSFEITKWITLYYYNSFNKNIERMISENRNL